MRKREFVQQKAFYARKIRKTTNATKRQTIPAFRQEGVWRIEKNYVRN